MTEQKAWEYISPEPNSGCWLWTGATNGNGYGQLVSNGKKVPAHRFFYEIHRGGIPGGLDLDHKCRMRCCVNPDHLEPVTRLENIKRSPLMGKWSHCRNGHQFTPENTKNAGGRQRCRICRNEYERARRARKRAA